LRQRISATNSRSAVTAGLLIGSLLTLAAALAPSRVAAPALRRRMPASPTPRRRSTG